MYQRARNSKVYPQLAPPRRDSFLIAGWDRSPTRERKPPPSNRAKFNNPSPKTQQLAQTISYERPTTTPRTKKCNP